MPVITLPSATVHYLDEGEGEPLLLLHANPGDSRDFEGVIPVLASRYRVLAIDWPGYGRSPMPAGAAEISVLFFHRVLGEFIAALALPPVLLIGNSLGGNAAARLAAEQPALVRGLVLVAPGGFTTPDFVSRFFCRLQGSRWSLSPYRFASLYLRHRTAITRAMLERAASSQSETPQLMLSRAIWRNFGTPDNDLRPLAPRIKGPTLLLFGRHDPVIAAKRDGRLAAALIPQSRLVVMPSGRASFAEIPEAFLAEVLPFLAGTLPTTQNQL
jgi:pimeloyl-ACP methyl ester carboxylesterase